MLFAYKAVDKNKVQREGTVEAANVDAAMTVIQQRGYTLLSIDEIEDKKSILNFELHLFEGVSAKEMVVLSRQIATLFGANVSPLRIFRLLSAEIDNPYLQNILNKIVDDLQGGSSISRALAAHPAVFSSFYISLVRAGEESGSLEKTFHYLADYLDRSYEMTSKAQNALIYPAFVILVFFGVMTLMLTMVIPRISTILTESGQDLPIYTKIVIAISDFLASYIGIIFIILGGLVFVGFRFIQTPAGKRAKDELLLGVPYVGTLQHKLVMTRFCDNLSTMLNNGIPIVQALELTSDVVDNAVYKEILTLATADVRAGKSLAEAMSGYPEISNLLVQMIQVGEETGSLAQIMETLATFYRREVNNAIDTLIGLIEPIMIVLLGLGVGVLLASVLMPIYSMTSAF